MANYYIQKQTFLNIRTYYILHVLVTLRFCLQSVIRQTERSEYEEIEIQYEN
jgi:hypothetical protein